MSSGENCAEFRRIPEDFDEVVLGIKQSHLSRCEVVAENPTMLSNSGVVLEIFVTNNAVA
jgi:hypothetical protein